MTPDEYLNAVLTGQTFSPDDPELQTLRERAQEVKDLLRSKLSAHSPSVRNAGSYAKGTMIRANYDFDILVYFDHETDFGGNLKEIRDGVEEVLREKYTVQPKRSSLCLLDANEPEDPEYFHIDVVPGRFMDGKDGKVALYQESGDRDWLQTDPEEHLKHVRESGVRDAIRLIKYWKVKFGITLPTFVVELLVIKLPNDKKDASLSEQTKHVWTEFRDNTDSLSVEDPANSNNDLSSILDATVKLLLKGAADLALQHVEDDNWEGIFGQVEKQSKAQKKVALKAAAAAITTPSRPYCDGGR